MIVEPEIIICNVCNKHIIDFKGDLFHVTAYIHGDINNHTHLCYKCFMKNVKYIPIIKTIE